MCMCSVAQLCPTLCHPVDHRLAGSSMECSKQEYWSELPFPTPVDLLDPGTEPMSLESPGKFFTTVPYGKP